MSLFESSSAAETKADESLLRLAATIDEFEGYAHPHAARIAAIANKIADVFNFSPHDCQSLRQAALVHDLGEAVMNREYIKRGGFLGEEERLDMMRHPVIGEQEAAKRGLSRAVQLIVRWHQEWWNGEGYPDGLRREQIPFAARILRVADSYVAITDDRPYCPAVPSATAKKFVAQWAGLEFDPRVVGAFLSLPDDIEEIHSFGEDNDEQPLVRRIYS